MKRMKRLFAVLLTLAMVLGMSATVFADLVTTPAAGKKGDTAEISVGGLATNEEVEAYAYQIIKATYEGEDEAGTFTGYEPLYDGITLTDANDDGVVDITEDQLKAVVAKINADGIEGIQMDVANGVAKATVPVGSYLVLIKNAETKVYSPIVVSAYYINKDGQNAITSDQITDVATEQAWVKVTDTPKVDKYIVEDGEDKKGNSVKIGDTIDYKVEVGPIPYYGGEHPTLNLVDTMDPGLDRITELEDVNVSIGETVLVRDTDYTIDLVDGNKRQIIINFVVNDKYTLNGYANDPSNKIVVTYQAKLNENATINQVPNKNDVELTYTTDSKFEGNEEKDDDIVYSYTFDIDAAVEGSITNRVVDKKGEEIDQVEGEDGVFGLDGAKFGLFTKPECTDNDYWTNEKTGFDGIIETTNGGQMPIKGLKAGTYYLKEIEAPDGYSLNTDVYKIEIIPTYTTSTEKKEVGKLVSWEIKINNVTMADSTGKTSTFTINNGTAEGETITATPSVDTTDILNTKLTNLPSTGGIGTTIFTIGGCLIMIIAAGLFFASRRKSSK